jgi:hypothetical protein
MGKGDQQRYIKITKIEIIFAGAWRHLVIATFHLRFPYDPKSIPMEGAKIVILTCEKKWLK